MRFEPIHFYWAQITLLCTKIVHAPILDLHRNQIAWSYCILRSGAGKRTAYAICIWGILNIELTLTADRKGSVISCIAFYCELSLKVCCVRVGLSMTTIARQDGQHISLDPHFCILHTQPVIGDDGSAMAEQ